VNNWNAVFGQETRMLYCSVLAFLVVVTLSNLVPEDGRSTKTQQFWMLHTIIRTL
jgi:hypothetical protein